MRKSDASGLKLTKQSQSAKEPVTKEPVFKKMKTMNSSHLDITPKRTRVTNPDSSLWKSEATNEENTPKKTTTNIVESTPKKTTANIVDSTPRKSSTKISQPILKRQLTTGSKVTKKNTRKDNLSISEVSKTKKMAPLQVQETPKTKKGHRKGNLSTSELNKLTPLHPIMEEQQPPRKMTMLQPITQQEVEHEEVIPVDQ